MKKKLFGLLACIALLGALLAAYFYLQNKSAQEESATEEEYALDEAVTILDRELDEVERFTLTVDSSVIEFVPNGSEDAVPWSLAEYPNAVPDYYALNTLSRGATQVSADKKAMDSTDDLSGFGLDPAMAVADIRYTDGTTEQLLIGKKTSDGEYNYLMRRGDPAIYLLSVGSSYKYFYTLEDVVDKSTPQIDGNNLQYAYIYNADRGEEGTLELVSTEQDEQLAQYGVVSLEMLRPLEGREAYVTNFVEKVMAGMDSMSFDELVDMDTENLEQYGLAEPQMEIILKDTENTFHLLVGNSADDGHTYVMQEGGYGVFTIHSEMLANFKNIDIFSFLNRFISLKNIDDVEQVTITHGTEVTEMKVNLTEIPAEGEDASPEKVYAPTINGTEVDEKQFKDVYQLVIALSFDTEVLDAAAEGEPALTIRFNMVDGTGDTEAEYYDYNNNFYVVKIDGGPARFVVNKQSVEKMLAALAELR